MISSGYFRCAANTGWNLKACWVVRDRVLWDTVWYVDAVGSNFLGADWGRSCCDIVLWLYGMSPVEIGCTCGGAWYIRRWTLGAGGLTGVAVGTLGALWFRVDSVWRGMSVVAVGAAVSPDQLSRVSWRALMDWICASTVDAGVSLRTDVSCCTPCSTFSSGVTDGRVSLWCLN